MVVFSIIVVYTRASFIEKLQWLLKLINYEDFETLNNVEKSSYIYIYMLGSELWECQFDGLLSLVKEYIYIL